MDRQTNEEDRVTDYGILGAGPAGLSMAMFLEGTSEVLEADDHPGGHAASFFEDGFTFDFGPHIMFSKHQAVLDFMINGLRGNVHQSRRNSKVCIAGHYTKYPIENDLAALPEDLRNRSLLDFLFNDAGAASPKAAARRGSHAKAGTARERLQRPDEIEGAHESLEEPDDHDGHLQEAGDVR